MLSRIILTASVAFLICNISAAIAVPPSSASVSGVKNVGWMPGVCSVASIGQLIQQKEPNISAAEVVVRSGICTQTAYISGVLVDHPRFLDMGEPTDVARLFGVGYSAGYKGRAPGIVKGADSFTCFKTVDDAANWLKELIAAGTPVQVHADTAYLANYGGIHGSHYVVVYGYDESSIYYCENGGDDGTRENMELNWDDFKAAWYDCYMVWLNNAPIRLDNDWILAWLARDIEMTNKTKSPTGPDAIRTAAAAIRKGINRNIALNGWMISVYGNWRPYMVEFLYDAGHPDLAVQFEQACAKWKTILDMPLSNPDWNVICDLMEQAVDIEEQVEAQMLALGEGLDAVYLCAPQEGANLATLEDCTFRWAQMPDVSKTVLQLAMTGNFADKRVTGIFKPKKNKWFIAMSKKDWLKVLGKDDDDRLLSWRVSGQGKDAGKVSADWTLGWDVQQMVSTAPGGDYAMAENELVTFTFESPWVATKPCVAISTTGDFNDKSSRLVLKPKSGQTSVAFKSGTLSALKKKDDGDGIIYWRAEDASAKTTTVKPSEARSLLIP
ncbi:MAG: BtrH N-terminal domain-containing protein [Sedimentisphaerales bacterium]